MRAIHSFPDGLGVGAVSAQAPPPQASTPIIHRTACSLGESMGNKLGAKKVSADAAKQTCQQLAPDMNETDHADFMRCCTGQLQK